MTRTEFWIDFGLKVLGEVYSSGANRSPEFPKCLTIGGKLLECGKRDCAAAISLVPVLDVSDQL